MKTFLRCLTLIAALLVGLNVNAQSTSLTVYDGTATNDYVPVYGYYADAYLRSQTVYPADSLTALNGNTITGLTFYASQSAVDWGATFEVKLTEITGTSLSDFESMTSATTVYTGSLAIVDGQMEVVFTTPYFYNGGNLLVEVNDITPGSYLSSTWYGMDVTGASVQGYSYTSFDAISATDRNFIPKTTFNYAEGALDFCYAVTNLTATDVTSTGATLTWSDGNNTGATYTVMNGETVVASGITDTTYPLTGLSALTEYTFSVVANCSATDTSQSADVTFVTACDGDNCSLTVSATGYCTVDLYQNGVNIATVDAENQTVEVCSNYPVVAICTDLGYSWSSPSITIVDAGNNVLFNGTTDSLYTGDTLIVITTPCPSCLGVDLTVDNVTSDGATLTWSDNNTGATYTVYNMADTSVVATGITNTTYTLTGLQPVTSYTYGVVANCSATDASGTSAISFTTPMVGNQVTVYEGTTTNDDVPVYGIWADAYLRSQTVYPADSLTDLVGDTINGLIFYATQSNVSWTSTFQVRLWEDTCTALSAFVDTTNANIVYTGTLSIVDGQMMIPFTTPYVYNGGNLILEVEDIVPGNYSSCTWYGTEVTGASWQGYNASSIADITGFVHNFIPQTTFNYLEVPAPPTDLTVYDGTTTNNYVPVHGLYVDDYLRSQTIYPADSLTAISGGTIYGLTFYASQASVNWGSPNFQVKLTEVANTTLTGFDTLTDATTVYTGVLSIDDYQMQVIFTTPYTYNGGSLLIEVENLNPSTYKTCSWYGNTVSGASWQGSNGSSVDNITGSVRNFIPKTTFGMSPICIPVSDLTASNLSTTGVTLSWSDGGNAGATYTVYNMADTSVVASALTDTTYTLSNLTANTEYTYGVVASCSATSVSRFMTITVNTPCEAFSVPYTETFDSLTTSTTAATGVEPGCWLMAHADAPWSTASYGPQVYYSSTYAHSGSYSLRLYNRCIYAMPAMNVNLNQLQVSFWVRQTNANYWLVVGVMSDLTDETSFVPVDTIICSSTSDPEQHTVYFDQYTGANGYIAFRNIHNGTYNYSYNYIDDVTVDYLPSCLPVSDMTVSNLTANGATLNWTDNSNTGATYTIYNMADNSVVASSVTGTSYTLTGLTENTDYSYGVMVDCGAGGVASVVSVSFHTPCAAVTVPYTENFDSYTTSTTAATGVEPNCWTMAHADASWTTASYGPQVYYGSTYAHSGSYSLRLYYRCIYALPEFTPDVDQLQMNFWVRQTSANYQLVVGVMSDLSDETTFVPVDTIICSSTSASEQHTVYFDQYTGADGYIAFRNINTGTASYSYNYIDDVTVDYLPSCFPVTEVTASDVAPNSATLTWTDNSNTSATYTIYNMADTSVVATGVSATTYALTGLTSNTTYTYGVRANCSATEESAISVVTFTTACDAESMPWSEDFDTWTAKSPCWSFMSGAFSGTPTDYSSAWILNTSYGSYITIDGKALTMNVYSTYRYWAVTPLIAISSDAAQFSVDVAVAAWSSATPNYDSDDTLAFAISTDGGATFTTLAVYDSVQLNALTNTYTTLTADVTGYNNQNVRFAIFAGSSASGGDNRIVIDNVAVEEVTTSTCEAVTDLTVSDVTTTSATLSWTDSSNTDATYTVMSGETVVDSGITATNYALTGLTANTQYTYSVLVNCSATETSTAATVTFNTAADSTGCETTCQVSIAGVDSYGDGWNGGYIVILQNSSVIDTFTVDASSNTESYTVCSDSPVQFEWYAGDYASEVSFTVYDGSGAAVYTCSDASSLTSDGLFTTLSTPCPTCFVVTVAASDITATGATLTWTDNNASATYTIYNMADTSVVASSLTDTTYALTGLTSNTTYTYGVRANCSATEESGISVVTFTTACDVEAMPWSEDFDTWTENSPCWSFMSGAFSGTPVYSSYAWSLSSSYGDHITIDGNALTMNVYSTYRFWAVTPIIAINNDAAQFSVDVAVAAWSSATPNYDSDDTLAFAITTDGGATFTTLAVYDNTQLNALSNTYTTLNIPVMGYNNQNVRFAIFGGSSASGGDNRLVIDNVVVDVAPNCMPVTGVTATDVTATGATLTWSDAYNTGATYTVMNGETVVASGITDTTYTLTGLSALTAYSYSVVANCSATEASLPANVTFVTACDGNTCSLTVSTSAYYSYSYYWPTVELYQNGVNIASVQGPDQVVEVCSNYPVVAIYGEPSDSYGPAVTIIDGGNNVLYNSATDSLLDGDTLMVITTPCPSCLAVDLTVDNVTSDGATLTWSDNNTGATYTVYNMADTSVVDTGITDTTYTLTGLQPVTSYTYGVVANCSATDASGISAISFTTPMVGNQVTVYEGTTTNSYVPVYGLYTDDYLRSQTVYPADSLTAMVNAPINGLIFYATQSNVSWTSTFQVRLWEDTCTALSAFVDTTNANIVYTGTLSIVDGQMMIPFTTPYVYNGGNLILEVEDIVPGNYSSCTWYGTEVTGASWQGYNASSIADITGSVRNFIPQTTFNYLDAAPETISIVLANSDTTKGSITPLAGTYEYNAGDTVVATAAANTGYSFASWTISVGDITVTDTNNPFTYVLSEYLAGQTITVTANWSVNDYTLTVVSNDTTLGTVTGGGVYAYGTTATLEATPATNCHFVSWSDGSTDATHTVTVDGDATYTATFAYDSVTVVLAVNDDEMGSINPEAGTYTYAVGETFTAEATANEGYELIGWSYNGAEATEMTDASVSQTFTADLAGQTVTYTAVFQVAPVRYNVTLTVQDAEGNANVGGTVTGDGAYAENEDVTITATPADGYTFVNWTDAEGTVISTEATYTFAMPAADVAYIAVFAAETQGIDDANMDNIVIYSVNDRVVVRGAENQTIRVFDVVGRLVAQRSDATDEESFQLTNTGVYMVQVGNAPARRVVVRK